MDTVEIGRSLAAPRDYGVEVASGNIPGVTPVRVTGRNAVVNTTERLLWQGGEAYNFLIAAATLRIRAGGNVNDAAAGTGAREITIVGLDTNGNLQTATLATNGTSASSATTLSFRRVNLFYVSKAGTYATGVDTVGSNADDISLETSGGDLLGIMPANTGTSSVALYTVPAGKTGFFQRLRITPETTRVTTFRLWTRKNFDVVSGDVSPKILRAEFGGVERRNGFDLDSPIKLDGKEEIWVSAFTNTGTARASTAFEIQVIDDR